VARGVRLEFVTLSCRAYVVHIVYIVYIALHQLTFPFSPGRINLTPVFIGQDGALEMAFHNCDERYCLWSQVAHRCSRPG
jgi:hypothetical protein